MLFLIHADYTGIPSMKTSIFKIPVFRYGVVVMLMTFLCGIIFYLSVNYNKTRKMQNDVNSLMAIHENSSQIDDCILNLYRADNDSRLYSVTGDTSYLKSFTSHIKRIDSILKKLAAARSIPINTSSVKISNLMDRKSLITKDYMHLRHLSDSLIKLTLQNPALLTKPGRIARKSLIVAPTVTTDTSIKHKKKKLFGRIADAISGKNSAKVDTVYISKSVVTPQDSSVTTDRRTNYYKMLSLANNGMRAQEREMLYINSGIIREILVVLNRYKKEEQGYIASRKRMLRGNLNTIFAGVSELSLLTGIFLSLLILILLYNTWKIFTHEKKLVAYSEDAIRFAEEKSAFLANMSHEIRTPLNSIAGFSEQLEQSSLNAEQSGQIKAVRNSAEMLLNVVNQVLDYSKYETGKMIFDNASFLLDTVLTEVTISMGILAEQKGIHLRSELKYNKTLYLSGDAFRLKQVIMNLVGNAIKFTKKGEVALHAWIEEGPAGIQMLHVAVNDTGMGISQADLPFIFKEFTQAAGSRKEHRSGTGLGLAISKSIVELQGGSITVESELGRGSVFSFTIPFKSGQIIASQQAAAFDEEEVRIFLKNKRVLLAEDNNMNVLLAKTILRKWNISCEVAYNGKEALALFEKNDYDLILTDINMPEMGGVELASLVRQISDQDKANIPILALTANVMVEDHRHYLGSGISAIALKPFFEKELIYKIQFLLKKITVQPV